jgi:hypothetical protein
MSRNNKSIMMTIVQISAAYKLLGFKQILFIPLPNYR